MLYTKPDEIELVKENLSFFDNKIPAKILAKLLTRQERYSQHGLFYSLCNPSIYPYLIKALESIKKYKAGKYFNKAIGKLVNDSDWLNHQANAGEVTVVGYYCDKFSNQESIEVVWEKEVNAGKNVDISLLGHQVPINIEITGLHQDSKIRYHFDLRNAVRVAIERVISKIPNPMFSYRFSIPEESTFTEKDIPDFVKFIEEQRKRGVGFYNYILNGQMIASVGIHKLNKLKEEYATDLDMWFGELNDDKRLGQKIVEKSKNQLPANERNYLCVLNLSGFDTLDIEEALYGKEQIHFNKSGEVLGRSFTKEGAAFVIQQNGYSPVFGLIASGRDYSKKKIILNALVKKEDNDIELIS